MSDYVRKNILQLTPYIAGKPIEETKRQYHLKRVIKLASNENPLGPSPKAVAAIKKNLCHINRYPDSSSYYLKKKLSRMLNVSYASLVLGNGSDELIDVIIKTFVAEDENIVTADTTFLEYRIIAQANGRSCLTCPLKYFKFDLEAIRSKINRQTKIVFIANPNNPTGTYVNRMELLRFLNDIPKGVLVVLDEAYDTFIDVADFPYGLNLLDTRKNIIVLKTFSKAYGLAGLRVGYAVSSPELASYMERVRQPFNVNSLAQAAAFSALDDKAFLERTRKLIWKEKQYLYGQFKKIGLAYVPSVANFILCDVKRDGAEVFKEMLKYGVIVRDMVQYGLKNFIRVTIGLHKENVRFVSVLKNVLRGKR